MPTPFPFTAGQVLTAAQLNAITTLPINDQTASYTLVVGDVGKRVIMNNAGSTTITVNNSVFAAGDTIFIANKGAGVSTITAGAGVTINTAGSLALAQYQSGSLIMLSASNALFLPTDRTVTSAVLQIVSTTKTDTFSMNSTTYADVTGLSVSITPSSASSRVLIIANLSIGTDPNNSVGAYPRLLRGSTAIAVGATAGSRISSSGDGSPRSTTSIETVAFNFVDSPATTSATTYKIQVRSQSANNVHVNRSDLDTDSATFSRTASTITVMEIV